MAQVDFRGTDEGHARIEDQFGQRLVHPGDERIQVLVEKIIVENRRRPFTSHFFTHDEVASPTPVAGNDANELDFYHWISEHIAQRDNLSEKPIIIGQTVLDLQGRECLGVRIRSPRGIDLSEAGLPRDFASGGLPNTAIARTRLVWPFRRCRFTSATA